MTSLPVKVTLADGIERALLLSYSALRKIRDEYGISFAKGKGYDTLDEDNLPAVMAIALNGAIANSEQGDETKAMTTEQVADLMDAEQTNEYFAQLLRAATGRNVMEAVKKYKAGGTAKTEPETAETEKLTEKPTETAPA